SGRPDERPALKIFLIARLLADHKHGCVRRPVAEHGLRRVLIKFASATLLRGFSDLRKRQTIRQKIGRRSRHHLTILADASSHADSRFSRVAKVMPEPTRADK